jgi:hypothetical protein
MSPIHSLQISIKFCLKVLFVISFAIAFIVFTALPVMAVNNIANYTYADLHDQDFSNQKWPTPPPFLWRLKDHEILSHGR